MDFSIRFISIADGVYSRRENACYVEQLINHLNLDRNSLFNKSLIVDISGDEFEVPVIATQQVEAYIFQNSVFSNKYANKVIIPLYDNTVPQNRRTFDSIITQFFNLRFSNRLVRINTNKGEVYYGGKGIILDGNFNPLLLCTLLARIVKEEGRDVLTYYRPVCHINPKVFIESDKLVNKGIIKKLIPYYSNYDTCFPRGIRRTVNNDPESEKVKVIIDDFSHLFVEPVKPTPSSCSNESLNQCLVDNVEDILALI